MKLETIITKVLSTQHQLLSVEFTDEWLAHLREQAETKQATTLLGYVGKNI